MRGGGLYNTGQAMLTNVTLAGNSASRGATGHAQGGGIFNGPNGSVVLRNTIVANNTARDGAAPVLMNCAGGMTDGGHNLDDGTSCGFTAANGSLSNTDPPLDPAGLRDDGGPTQTIALLPGSPAIDAGGPGCPPTDQRGVSRPHGAACDIGAYEFVPVMCTGDCRGTGAVAITDLLTLVNIILGNAQFLTCVTGVPSGAQVNVALILQAVHNGLNGC